MTSRTLPVLAAVLTLATAPALAAPRALPTGDFAFETIARENGRPICTETWIFEGDILTVRSGEEIVRKRVRMEEGGPHGVLVSEVMETNGAPDCMGRRSPEPAPGEGRVLLLDMNAGYTMLCPAPQGSGPHVIGNCWGRLTPRAR